MITAVRFSLAAVWATLIHGSRAIRASWRNLPDTIGGPYDQAAIGWSRRLLQAARITVRVEGPAQLRPRPAVYVANHVSMIDIPVIVTALPLAPKFVMKKELLRVPVFGRGVRRAPRDTLPSTGGTGARPSLLTTRLRAPSAGDTRRWSLPRAPAARTAG